MVKKAVQKLYLGNQEVNLATSGIYPEGTINITENGVHDVTPYKNANVTSLTEHYVGFKAEDGVLTRSDEKINLKGIKSIRDDNTFYYVQRYNNLLTGSPFVNAEELESISGERSLSYAFADCVNITTTGLGSVKVIGNDDLSSASMLNEAYAGCTSLTNIELDNLEKVQGNYALSYAFEKCTSLVVARFPKLRQILTKNNSSATTEMFADCTALTDVYFPALVVYNGINANTYLRCLNPTIHFRADSDFKESSVIQAGFNGYATVLFDQGDFDSKIYLPNDGSYRVYVSANGSWSLDFRQLSTTVEGDYVVAQFKACNNYPMAFLIVCNDKDVYFYKYTPTESSPDAYVTPDFSTYAEIIPDSNYADGVTYTLTIVRHNVQLFANSGQTFRFANVDDEFTSSLQLSGVWSGYPSTSDYSGYIPASGTSETWTITIETYISQTTYTGSELSQLLDPSIFGLEYWSVDGDDLVIAPTVKTTVTTNSAMSFDFDSGVSYVRFKLTYSLGSEPKYDFGYLALGDGLISRTAAQIKNGTIENGIYLFRLDGAQTTQREAEITVDVSTGFVSGTKYITIGWGQDNSTTSNGNYFRINQLEITQY